MFQLVELIPGSEPVPLRRKNGTLRTLKTGKRAAKLALIASNKIGRKVQPRRFAVDDWRKREKSRLEDGTYTALPWANEPWWQRLLKAECKDHYAHVSRKHPGRVAYTETDQKGMADLQTPLKAGRYLQKFALDEMNAAGASIALWAARFADLFEANLLQFAETKEDIVDVYMRGPSSCMSHSSGDYSCRPHHPVEAYASGDLAVAYLERGGRVTARALCCPRMLRYSRIYGDLDRLRPLLEAAGYRNRNLDGAKLLKIPAPHGRDDRYVMPYIDGVFRVTDCGTHFEIDEGGEICADNTYGLCNGHADVEEYTCENCEGGCGDTFSVGGRQWCNSCYRNESFACRACGERYDNDNLYTVLTRDGGQAWCNSCADDGAVYTSDYDHVAQTHFEREGGVSCDTCGNSYLRPRLVNCGNSACTIIAAPELPLPPPPPAPRRVPIESINPAALCGDENCIFCYRDEIAF